LWFLTAPKRKRKMGIAYVKPNLGKKSSNRASQRDEAVHDPLSPRVVLVCGAGASLGATSAANALPTQSDLLQRMVSLNVVDGSILKSKRVVMEYLDAMYPGRKHYRGLPFEEVIGPLEWLESQESGFHLGSPSMRNKHTLRAFDHLLSFLLARPNYRKRFVPPFSKALLAGDVTLYDEFYGCCIDSANAYSRLLSLAHSQNVALGIVSFNYDLLLDRVLLHGNSPYSLEYRIPFSGKHPQGSKAGGQSLVLAKPHGSLNWAWCTICNRVTILGTSAVMPGDKCQGCSTVSTMPLLIRPSFAKEFRISGRVWQSVLDSGRQMLSSADTLIFIGYSFPIADYWVRAWLRSALARHEGSRPNIVLVDPDPFADVRARYEEFFGSPIVHHKMGFFEFAVDVAPTALSPANRVTTN
jgi:hypothetical protein